jgi:hypothetical protein
MFIFLLMKKIDEISYFVHVMTEKHDISNKLWEGLHKLQWEERREKTKKNKEIDSVSSSKLWL